MGLEVLQDEPMKRHTSFEIGGPVDIMLIPRSIDEILESIRFCRDRGIEYFIMGNGSNLLVRDTGIRGVVIKIGNGFDSVERRGDRLYCESGISLSTLAKFALEESLTGLEFASGIPGTIGGAITMNAGAYDGEMKDIVSKVVVLDGDNDVLEIDGEDMGFRYRGSRVIDEGLIVLGVELELREDEYSIIKDTMEDLNRRRATKQPQEFASGGSTFKRPTGYYAGKLIDDAGLRGLRHGDAQVSEKHCGFIVNRGNATFEDVMNLIGTVQKVVRDKFDVTLETEIRIVGD
ncbi:MAG: UDP-N-acetylmuramate dehydrogenase [Tissierellia bacterium]|nr:UDP-N-acetylmuramate dehydrogenase [Tissierellia bacterium]